jgi:glycosyltransferase involved in cell wall biosynthesis
VGGIETVTCLLAGALTQLGENVSVITRELSSESSGFEFEVIRRPRPIDLFRKCRAAGAVILQGPTIRLGWPLLWRRPGAIMIHHLKPGTREGGLCGLLRAKLARCVRHGTVSGALAKQLPWPVGAVLQNPYDAKIFRVDPGSPRSRDIIFVGRLIPEKGVSVLIKALSILRQRAKCFRTTVIGEGPERDRLERSVREEALENDVQFSGEVTGIALAKLLNQHRLLVVPSLGYEAFGLAALEAIACGCVVIGSNTGGLPEAIGSCGKTFPMGHADSLASSIEQMLSCPEELAVFRAEAESHLAAHEPLTVARQYLEFLRHSIEDAESPCVLS